MYISEINIQNYRWIKNETLYFDRFNTLIGKNDCWKSTIINAIKLFFNDEKASQKDFNFYVDTEKNIVLTVILSGYAIEDIKTFLVWWEKADGFEEIVNDFVIDGKIILRKVWEYKDAVEVSSTMYIQVNDFEEQNIYNVKGTDLSKYIKEHAIEVPVDWSWKNSDLEKKAYIRQKFIELWRNQNSYFLDIKHKDIADCIPAIELFKADQSIETTTTEFKNTFTSEVKDIIRTERGNWSSSTLNGIETKISEKIKEESIAIQKCMTEHISDLSNLIITPSFSWEKGVEITNVEIQLKWDERPIPLENKGSWYRRLFMVWRLRYLADKKQSENVIYLVEEPETFLHPSAQDEMLHSLISLSEFNQIFITTHSPIFTGATKQNAITLCSKEHTELKYNQNSSEDFLIQIAQQLWVKPTHNILDTYKWIIFVEGSNDRRFLQIASEKLLKTIHSLEGEWKIAIIEGWWKSLWNFIDIDFFARQQKPMFLIIDSDIYDPSQITEPNIQSGLNNQQRNNAELKIKFETKPNSKCFILKKKNIDTYYHPAAIRRINTTFPITTLFADNFCFDTYVKANRYDPVKNPTWTITWNLKSKNLIDVFETMTNEEWREVSGNELETIFDEIITLVE